MRLITHEDEGTYRFDAFQLDPTRRLLLNGGEVVQLTPKSFETLLALVRNRGRVMEKDELMQAVWPDTIVEETNLAHNISALRKLLGQKGADNRFIVTVPGRGYSFVAEVFLEPPVLPPAVVPVDEQNGEPALAVQLDQQPAPGVALSAPVDSPVGLGCKTAASAKQARRDWRNGIDRAGRRSLSDLGIELRQHDAYPIGRSAAVQTPGSRPARRSAGDGHSRYPDHAA